MMLLAMTRREWIHAVLRIARQSYYFVLAGRGQWRGMDMEGILHDLEKIQNH
jgi:hypothetical protein